MSKASTASSRSAGCGVEAVSLARELQIGSGYAVTDLEVKDNPSVGTRRSEFSVVAPNYFRTLGIRLTSGRDFTPEDRETATPVVIITEATARRFWPGASPLCKQVRVGGGELRVTERADQ